MGNIIGSQSGLSSSVPGLAQAQSTSDILNSGGNALHSGMSTPTSLSGQSMSSFAPINTFQSEGGPGLKNLAKTNPEVWQQSLIRPTDLMANNLEQTTHQQNVTDSNNQQLLASLHSGLGALKQNLGGNQQPEMAIPTLQRSGLSALSAPTTMTPGLINILSHLKTSVPTNVSYLLK